jgi:hypothetical protein
VRATCEWCEWWELHASYVRATCELRASYVRAELAILRVVLAGTCEYLVHDDCSSQ